MPWGFVSPSAYLRVHVTLMGQVELCRGGAKCSRAPTLETMSCVSRGLAYERTHICLLGGHAVVGDVHDC